MWKWLIGVALAVVVLAGGVAFFAMSRGAGQAGAAGGASFAVMFGGGAGKDEATAVQLSDASRGDLVRTVSAPGSIEPRTLVKISSQVSAKITALPFREGDAVRAGEVVVRLDPQNLLAQLASAEAGLRIEQARLDGAKADLINARLDYERLTNLHETGDVPRSELDASEARFLQAQSGLKAIEGSIAVAQANIERVKKDIENTVITSPIAGTVTALNSEVGETAIVGTTNTPGSVIMEIADRSKMLLKAQVDETNIAPVRVGQTATVYVNAYEDAEFRGTVDKIGLKRQVTQQGTGYFVVEIALDLADGQTLLSGLSASTDISVETLFDTVVVPSQAVLDVRVDALDDGVKSSPHVNKDKTFTRVVYRFIDGEAVCTPVEVGPSDLRSTAVLKGLEPGERVVSGPFRELGLLTHKKKIKDEDAPAEDAGAEGAPAEGGVASTEEGATPAADAEGAEGAAEETATGEAGAGDAGGSGS